MIPPFWKREGTTLCDNGDKIDKTDKSDKTDEHKENKKSQNSETLRALAHFSQIGITVAASVFTGVMLGKILDNFLGTTPWLLLIFSLMGAGAAIKSIFEKL